MTPHHITRYRCDVCSATYETEREARQCEAQPVTQDKGVKVGDTVLILTGDGKGSKGVVRSVAPITKDWGHYHWRRYWHTVGIVADIVGSWGSRFLTFDDYRSEA